MNDMIDNTEVTEVMGILEEMEDELLAVELLKDFNALTKQFGQLLLNKDPGLDHAHWKTQCDDVKGEVDKLVKRIKTFA